MKKILVLIMVLTSWCFGAMTRDQVCIEQNGWHQASLTNYRGFNVWTPYGRNSDEWLCWMNAQEATYQGYSNYTVFKCKVKAGYYMALNKTITNGSAGPIWYPAVDGGGAGIDITQSAAWSVLENANVMNFTTLYTATNGRYLDLKVPAGITRLYMVAPAITAGNNAVTIAAQSGTATIPDSSISLNLTGDMTTYGEKAYYPNAETVDTTDNSPDIYAGYPHYQSVCLIATNCGGATIRITGVVDGTNYPYVVGFIAINDNATAQPDTGVFDPTTIEYLMPTSYSYLKDGDYLIGVETPYGQVEPAPLCFNIAGGTHFFWGTTPAHSTATNRVVAPIVGVYYDNTLYADYDITSNDAWTLPTADAWVRYTANAVTVTTKGVISLNQGATTIADAGTAIITYQYTPSGCSIAQKLTFNTNVDAGGTEVYLDKDFEGGYVCQWTLDNEFTKYLRQPYDTVKQAIGELDGTEKFATNVTAISVFDEAHGVTALFNCGFSYYDDVKKVSYSKPQLALQAYTTGDGYPKFYLRPIVTTDDIPVKINDEVYSFQNRILTNRDGLEADYTRSWNVNF